MVTREEIRISHWYNATLNKRCKVHSRKRTDHNLDFRITGYNPLPCKTFVGTYSILCQWLKANGWEHNTKEADIVIINITITN